MDLVRQAMRSLVPNKEEDEPQRKKKTGGSVKEEDVKFLNKELRSIRAALRVLGEVPLQDLQQLDRLWAGDLRELSYDIEDVLDAFMVTTEGLRPANPECCFFILRYIVRRPTIADAIKDARRHIAYIAERRDRYHVDRIIVARTQVDPRLMASASHEVAELVGVDEAMQDLISRLIGEDGVSEQQLKVVSVVGFGGLGKTTVARAVYQKLRWQFDCGAFISLSRNPNMKKVIFDLLCQINDGDINQASGDLTGLIKKLGQNLKNVRYFIVIDDIWDKKSWTTIKHAMVENNNGSIIITTTRNFELAEEIGSVYKLKPLSPGDSKTLLFSRINFRRILGGDEYPSDELTEVSDKILKKCGGLPLAIISVGGILCTERSREDISFWREVYNSIDSGCNFDLRMENMRSVLLISYYDLPFHLRNCLLSISVFPEDCKIRRDRLVCRWIAEGFVQVIQGCNLLEVGHSYFRELLNRGMIEEVGINDGSDETDKYCRVHDIMLCLVRCLSREENFVTVLDEETHSPPHRKIRRLSLQTSKVDDAAATMGMYDQVRSVTVYGGPAGINQMPPLSRFEVLRVMDLEGCHLKQSYSLEHVGKLLHLRYLGLRGTLIAELPKNIETLRFLQILDIVRTEIKELPPAVALLQRLMCLYVDHKTRLPDRMGRLTSLLELSNVCTTHQSPNFVRELQKLTELTALGILWHEMKEPSLEKELLDTLGKLHKLQTLNVHGFTESAMELMREEGWVPPPDLRTFVVRDAWFSLVPSWIIRSASRLKLTELQIGVRELRQEDLQALGMLQDLRTLQLAVERTGSGGGRVLVVDGGGASFPCLRELRLRGEACHYQLVFQEGAGPKVRVVELHVDVDRAKDSLVWGLGSLPSLQDLYVAISMCGDAESRQQEAETALRQAAAAHPNRPTLHMIVSSDQERHQEDEPETVSNVSSQEIEECSTSMRSARQS